MEYCRGESFDSDMSHVVEMDDCSHVMLSARCSETFRQALQYNVYNTTVSTTTTTTTTISTTPSSSWTTQPVTLTDNQLDEDEDDEEDEVEMIQTAVKQTAGRRAWNRLRVYVDEQAVRRRHNDTTMNWTLIRRTLGTMSQLQQLRDLLYQRYLEHPDDWLSGFINCPVHLMSQRRTAKEAAAKCTNVGH